MLVRIAAKKYYEPLALMVHLANMTCTHQGRARLKGFKPRDCERYSIPGGWLFSTIDATRYAEFADAVLRLLADVREMPEHGTTNAISLPRPPAPPEVVLDHNGRLARPVDFFIDAFPATMDGRDIRRIRICPICGKLFIAFRKDASACRGDCTNTNNKRRFDSGETRRRYRANHKQNIRAKRRRESLKRQLVARK